MGLRANEYLCRRNIADYIEPERPSSCAACLKVGECATAHSQRSEIDAAHWDEKFGCHRTGGFCMAQDEIGEEAGTRTDDLSK